MGGRIRKCVTQVCSENVAMGYLRQKNYTAKTPNLTKCVSTVDFTLKKKSGNRFCPVRLLNDSCVSLRSLLSRLF